MFPCPAFPPVPLCSVSRHFAKTGRGLQCSLEPQESDWQSATSDTSAQFCCQGSLFLWVPFFGCHPPTVWGRWVASASNKDASSHWSSNPETPKQLLHPLCEEPSRRLAGLLSLAFPVLDLSKDLRMHIVSGIKSLRREGVSTGVPTGVAPSSQRQCQARCPPTTWCHLVLSQSWAPSP